MISNIQKFQFFPSHLVSQSPWPILVSFSLLNFTVGAVLYMHEFSYGGQLFFLGLILTVAAMTLWFRDVITEATYLGHHTKQVKEGIMLGFTLFIISEVFAFLSVFWAFFHSSLSPSIELGGNWPPLGIETLDPFAIPLLNTFFLLSSGAFITWAHHSLIAGGRKAAIDGIILTISFAVVFTLLQYFEYSQAGFTIADGVFASSFFATTGLHGFHIIIGTIFILVSYFRLTSYHYTRKHHAGLESSIYYWHFVDVVWLLLFIAVYFWSGNTPS